MEYRRGDVFYIEGAKYYADIGKVATGGRPAIIISNDVLNKHSDYVEVVYLTSQDKKPLPTHCTIICKRNSTVMCETVYTVNKDRIGDYIRSCTDEEMAEINECLLYSLDLSCESDKNNHAIEVERDLYKNLYEQLLDKMTVR